MLKNRKVGFDLYYATLCAFVFVILAMILNLSGNFNSYLPDIGIGILQGVLFGFMMGASWKGLFHLDFFRRKERFKVDKGDRIILEGPANQLAGWK